MVFSTPLFIFLFLPLVLVGYSLLPFRNLFLLAASLLFYAWGEMQYSVLLLISIALNYFLVRVLVRRKAKGGGKEVVFWAVVSNLLLLMGFKYANFLVDNLNVLLGWMGWEALSLVPVHLPLGISFFTFQALTYVIDVYRGDAEGQKNPLNVALYISLFPQLVAGPIVRYREVARQIVDRRTTAEGFALGVWRFSVGLAKKVLIANTLSVPADAIFGLPAAEMSMGLAWLGTVCYAFQIYFDFSGYSDMAIGLGHMFGFTFPENFLHPYISRSVREFWRRWHITLSFWFRDYLYLPLGGSRKGPLRTYTNLLLVFFLCGLWHGASWTFVVWGLFHGVFLVLERAGWERVLRRLWTPLQHGYTLVAVLAGWVLFRCDTLPQAGMMLRTMAGLGQGGAQAPAVGFYADAFVRATLAAAAIGSIPVAAWLGQKRQQSAEFLPGFLSLLARSCWRLAEFSVVTTLLVASALALAASTHNPFIYFRF